MKKHQNFTHLFFGILLLSLFGCLTEKIESIELISESTSSSRSSDCMVTISGTIVDTKDLSPIENATVSSKFFTAKTNADGLFETQIKIDQVGQQEEIIVEKKGYLVNEFPVYYDAFVEVGDCSGLVNINWDIRLAERKEFNWISTRDGAWYKIMDTVAYRGIDGSIEQAAQLYTIDIRRGTVQDFMNISVSPDNNRAIGPGIPTDYRDFAVDNFVVEEDRFGSSGRNNTEIEFLKPIEILFSPPSHIKRGNDLPVLYDEEPNINNTGDAEFNYEDDIYVEVMKTGKYSVFGLFQDAEFAAAVISSIKSNSTFASLNRIINSFISNTDLLTETTDQLVDGQTLQQEIFGNCECNDGLRSFSYAKTFNGNEELSIRFRADTPLETQRRALAILRSTLTDSGDAVLSPNLSFTLEECSSATINSKEIRHIKSGTVLGFRYQYEATKELETNLLIQNSCAFDVDSSCHQGC